MTSRRALAASTIALTVAFASVAHADDKVECINAAQTGQSLRVDKKLTDARNEFLVCSRELCPAMVRNDCVKWLGEVDAATATVVVRARDASGHDVVDVRVLVDGKEVAAQLAGTSIPVDPGKHKFRYEAAGVAPIEDTVLIAEGEKGRLLRVDLGGQTAAPIADSTATGTQTAAPSGVAADTSQQGGKSPVPWIIAGVGLASLVAFGVTEILLQGEVSSLKSGCGSQRNCSDGDLSAAKTERTIAEITFGVGLVGIAVGVPWIIVQSLSHKKADSAAPSAFVDFRATRGGGVGVFGATF